MNNQNIIIVTLKKWNIKNFNKIREILPAYNFILIKTKEDLNLNYIQKINPKYIFFPHWSFIIPDEIYQNYACIVFHMSDLPFGRGGSPLQNLILQNIKKTKISALKVCKDLDAGDIYLKCKLDISKDSAQKIYKKASKIIFFKMIPYILTNNPKPIPQNGKPTFFKRRTPDQSCLNSLENPNLEKIFDFIRILDAPSYPKAFLELKNLKIEFKKVKNKKNHLKGEFKIYEKNSNHSRTPRR
ncbi:formyltransferase family protein [Campylobacter jejuni]|nr:methionyl-tRNA formyltransferase [Campylobacter jejuni]EDP3947842.1 methionyl-tRNA formyltransferase [Campylobacter jejuni]KAK0032400.1 formyltransferase family protein [Campylobacter jejuni]MCW1671520.1 formyltransferase family protein [Campylobacter jejuni]HED4880204.1 methionyl-tRNA formyltransferase [Campylobacter jejuni]